MNEQKGWIGVDLDGTLADYGEWKGPEHIGLPIPPMVDRIKKWRSEGKEVRIFTARVAQWEDGSKDIEKVRSAIVKWCIENIGEELPITNVKDWRMTELWDDRAKQVVPNTGEPVEQYVIYGIGTERRLMQDVALRQAHGLRKYGTTVSENPLTLRQWLQHAYEECLDQAVYLRRAIEEIDNKS